MRNIFLIARREYLERVRAKSFLIMTILIPVLMGGAIGGIALLAKNNDSGKHFAILTNDPTFAADLQAELTGDDPKDKPIVNVYGLDDAAARASLDDQLKAKGSTLDGYLVVTPSATPAARPSFQWVPRVKSDVITRGRVADASRGAIIRQRLATTGMAPDQVDAMMKSVDLSANDTKSAGAGAAVASAYAMYFLMYFIILFYGMNVARSIIEEKTSRVFEVMLASVKPDEMLAGKVVGVGAVGLTQVGLWITAALVYAKSSTMATDMQILPGPGQFLLFVVFFLLGYLLYSSFAAALGAMNNSEQELQQMQIFMMLPLIFSSMIIFLVITNPDGIVAKLASYFPFTAPLIMYTRVIVGKPTALEVGGTLVGLVLTIAVVLWIASRIYRVGILMYGKKPNLPEILRWLKYS